MNRNLKVVVDKWRFDMDLCIVNIIEESCQFFMRFLGYRFVNRFDKIQYDFVVLFLDG